MFLYVHHLQIIISPKNYLKKDYHLRAVDCAYEFKKTWLNPAGRIDTHIMDCSAKNFMLNS